MFKKLLKIFQKKDSFITFYHTGDEKEYYGDIIYKNDITLVQVNGYINVETGFKIKQRWNLSVPMRYVEQFEDRKYYK